MVLPSNMPLAVDLFCGKGGWTIGLQAAGWDVIGFDIAADLTRDYPGHLCIQDVATISGYPMCGKVSLIVASPPCQRYSYMAMPWSRAKAQVAEIMADESGEKLRELNRLFNECFRIAREAGCPLVIENVRGAQSWVGRAAWNCGSFYLWGDVPALMPTMRAIKNSGGSWFGQRDGKRLDRNDPTRDTYQSVKLSGGHNHPGKMFDGIKQSGNRWHDPNSMTRKYSSRSAARREASAQIAMIPFDLAKWIGEVYLP